MDEARILTTTIPTIKEEKTQLENEKEAKQKLRYSKSQLQCYNRQSFGHYIYGWALIRFSLFRFWNKLSISV